MSALLDKLPAWARTVLLALAYAALADLALKHFSLYPGLDSLVWPASGLALAAVVLGGAGLAPGILLGAFAAVALNGAAPAVAAAVGAGNALAALAGARLLGRFAGWNPALAGPADFARLGLAGAVAAGIAATVGVGAMAAAGVAPPDGLARPWFNWWQGDSLGVVLVAPLLLVWRSRPRGWFAGARAVEALACFGLAFLAGQVVFLGWFGEDFATTARAFWMFPFIAWAAARFGMHGVTLIGALAAVQATLGIVQGRGYFAGDLARSHLASYWLFFLILGGVGTSLALFVAARRRGEEALAEERRLLAESLAVAGIGNWTVDADTGRVAWSEQTRHIYGLPPGEGPPATFAAFLELLHPDDRPRMEGWAADCLAGRAPPCLEFRAGPAGGDQRWLRGCGSLERDAAGQPLRMVGTVEDITARRRTEDALRASEQGFRQLAEAVPQLVWIAPPAGGATYLNEHWTDYTGLGLEDCQGDRWIEVFHPDERARVTAAWADAVGRRGAYSVEARLRARDGSYRWWLTRGVPMLAADGGILQWFGTCTDVDELKRTHARTSYYAAEQERRIEAERRRIAREVHDQIGQVFTAIKLIVESLPGDAVPPDLGAALAQALEMGIVTTRKVTAELRPPLLDDLGLASALEHLARRLTKPARVDCEVDIHDADRLGEDARLILYRIAQEAISNVLRHAGASRLYVFGIASGGRYHLRLADDGRGFDPQNLPPDTMGLRGMQERTALLGGTCLVKSAPGRGTEIIATVPLGPAP